jgi:AcrR family transcriptional regulator
MVAPNTAERLVQIGIDVLLEEPEKLLYGGLDIDKVVRRAHVSETTFYRLFSKRSFIEAVLDHLVPEDFTLPFDMKRDIADRLIASQGDPLAAIREVATWDYLAVREWDVFTRALAAMAIARSRPSTARNLKASYTASDDAGKAAYETLFAQWGATLRKPFTVKLAAICLTAMVDGMTLRWLADPESVPDWLFGEMVLAFVISVVDTGQQHEHINDVAAPLAATITASFQSARGVDLPPNPRKAVLDAARKEFGQRGYFTTTIDHISTTSGVPLHTLKQLFHTKSLLIIGGLQPHHNAIAQHLDDDVRLGYGTSEIIERFLANLAEMTVAEREFTDALIMVVAHDTQADSDSTVEVKQRLNFPALLEPVIRRGQAAGELTGSLDPLDVAAALTNALFIRCFTRRDDDPQRHARFVIELALNGALRRQ